MKRLGFTGAFLALLLAATAALAQSQHITLLQSQGEYHVVCDSSEEVAYPGADLPYPARTYADLTGMDRGCLAVSVTGVDSAPTLLLYYRPIGDSIWAPSGLSVTVAAPGYARGVIGSIPAPMAGPVELTLWSAGTGGALFPLSVAAVFSQ